MKIENRSSSAHRQESSCKSAGPQNCGQGKSAHGKAAFNGLEAKNAVYKQVEQAKRSVGSQQGNNPLPASTTRAIDPDRIFYNGFLLENPVNRGDSKRPICSFDSSGGQRAENINRFWDFTGDQPGNSAQGSGKRSNVHPSASSSEKGSDGSINNIQRVYQKASKNRAASGKKKDTSLMDRDHSLVRGEHRHSDDKLARDLVPTGRGRDGPAHMKQGGHQQNLSARAVTQRKRDPLHIVHGFFCQWCLFENEACDTCNREMCIALKLPIPSPAPSVTKSGVSGQAGAKQQRNAASAPYKFERKPEPQHILQGNFCVTCLFEDSPCDECQASERNSNLAKSRLASRLNAIEQNSNGKKRNAKSARANTSSGEKSSSPVSPYAVTLKKSQSLSPVHIEKGYYCQYCLFENEPCDSCLRDIFANASDEVKRQFVMRKSQGSMAEYVPVKSQQMSQTSAPSGPNELQWRRPLSAWRSQKAQQSETSKSEFTGYGASQNQQGQYMVQQQGWIQNAGGQSQGGWQETLAFRSSNVSTCNPQPKKNGGRRSRRQQQDKQAGQYDSGSRGEYESHGYGSEEYAVDHSGVMRPNKTYTGRTKQSHWDAKSKRQHF